MWIVDDGTVHQPDLALFTRRPSASRIGFQGRTSRTVSSIIISFLVRLNSQSLARCELLFGLGLTGHRSTNAHELALRRGAETLHQIQRLENVRILLNDSSNDAILTTTVSSFWTKRLSMLATPAYATAHFGLA